jgi:hypothetical protein
LNNRNKFILKSIKNNLKIWVKFSIGKKEHIAGKRFFNHSEEEVIEVINTVYNNYKKYGDIGDNFIKNKKILEIGPGDSFGVALNFMFAGAKEVICYDKFYANRNENLLKEVYKKMFKKQSKYTFTKLFNKNLFPKQPIKYYYGKGIEEVKLEVGTDFYKDKFDLIISNQVLQEIYNPKPAFKKMIDLLNVKGKMIHHIDFEPYNYFKSHSKVEYDFLTYNSFIYKWMVNKRGMSNRKRITEYIHFLDSFSNIKYKFLVYSSFLNKKKLSKEIIEYPNFSSEVKGYYATIVNEQKINFNKKYKQLPLEDFIVGNAFLIIEKTNKKEPF